MKLNQLLLLALTLVLLVFSVDGRAQSFLEKGKVPSDLLITLERTPCFGTCPDYTLTINAKGAVNFKGGRFTKVKGSAIGKLTSAQIKNLIKKFDSSMFVSLKDNYNEPSVCGTMITDLPWEKLSIAASGRTKKVVHDLGCVGNKAVRSELGRLTDLTKYIDEMTNSKRWVANK